MNLSETLVKSLGPPPRKECTYVQSHNITCTGPCTPGSILIDNEEEESWLLTISNWNRHFTFETISLWFSGRLSLSTRVWMKISFFSSLRFYFASVMYLYPNVWWFKKARRLSKRVCRRIQEGDETVNLWPQNRTSLYLQGPILDQTESEGKKLWAWVFPFTVISGENNQNRTWETQYLTVLTLWLPGSFVVQGNEVLTSFVKCAKYASQISIFQLQLCNSHEPFLPCAPTCVSCFNPFLPISGFSAHRCGIDSVALYSQLCSAHLFHHVPDQGGVNYLSLWIKQLVSSTLLRNINKVIESSRKQ